LGAAGREDLPCFREHIDPDDFIQEDLLYNKISSCGLAKVVAYAKRVRDIPWDLNESNWNKTLDELRARERIKF
jgi:hypothetical protein